MKHNTHYEVRSSEGCEVHDDHDAARAAFLRFQQDNPGIDVSLTEVHRHGRRRTIGIVTYGELEVIQERALRPTRPPEVEDVMKSVPHMVKHGPGLRQRLNALRKLRVESEIAYTRRPSEVNRLVLAAVYHELAQTLMEAGDDQTDANNRYLAIPQAA